MPESHESRWEIGTLGGKGRKVVLGVETRQTFGDASVKRHRELGGLRPLVADRLKSFFIDVRKLGEQTSKRRLGRLVLCGPSWSRTRTSTEPWHSTRRNGVTNETFARPR